MTTSKEDNNKQAIIYLSLNEEQLLAEQVQKHPILYNKYTKGHLRDKDELKNEAWADVADNLHYVTDATQAQKLFFVLKKKFLRKRREVKDAYRGGSQTTIAKAEKAYRQYEFLHWLSEYLQERETRRCNTTSFSNSWSNGADKKDTISDHDEGSLYGHDMDEIPTMVPKRSLATPSSEISTNSVMIDTKIGDSLDSFKSSTQTSTSQQKHGSISPTGSYKYFQMSEIREGTQRSVKNTAPIDAVKFRSQADTTRPELLGGPSSTSGAPQKIHSPGNKRKLDSPQQDKDEIFCKGLVLDLKELPLYERLHAKQEMRNVLFKYQIAVMEKQQNQEEDQR
ncbi:uncharacterized protein [Clytia hemisphaerica]